MDCRNGSRELDDDARFCPWCGVPAASIRVGCGGSVDADARFCKHCGHGIDQALPRGTDGMSETIASAAPLAARERKTATLLFADVVGFTELGGSGDHGRVSEAADTLEALGYQSYLPTPGLMLP